MSGRKAGASRIGRVRLHPFARAILAGVARLAAIALIAIGALQAWKLREVREAQHALEQGFPAVAARALKPWFDAGLLDGKSSRMLMVALLQSKADPGRAVEAAQECIRSLSDADCAIGLGVAYAQLKLYDEAESVFLRVIGQRADLPGPHRELAEVARQQGKTRMAIAEYGAAIGYTKDEKEKRYCLQRVVEMLNQSQRYIETAPYLRELVSLSESDWPEGLYAAAAAQLGLQNDDEFMKIMGKAEKLRESSKVGAFFVLSHPALYERYEALNKLHPKLPAPAK